ncbi:hypothetical protein A2U01_0026909, partial [Trifolium medium]|nr:hypothetical protein [Trifolium medium]
VEQLRTLGTTASEMNVGFMLLRWRPIVNEMDEGGLDFCGLAFFKIMKEDRKEDRLVLICNLGSGGGFDGGGGTRIVA